MLPVKIIDVVAATSDHGNGVRVDSGLEYGFSDSRLMMDSADLRIVFYFEIWPTWNHVADPLPMLPWGRLRGDVRV